MTDLAPCSVGERYERPCRGEQRIIRAGALHSQPSHAAVQLLNQSSSAAVTSFLLHWAL